VLGGFMGAWVLSHFIEDAWAMVWAWQPQIRRPDGLYSQLAGITIAVLGTIYALRKERWFKFSIEVIEEISQVTWPTRSETRAATIVVIVITLICSTILWAMDQTWSTVTNWLYGI
jgi:preprotein translocase subunit SecE